MLNIAWPIILSILFTPLLALLMGLAMIHRHFRRPRINLHLQRTAILNAVALRKMLGVNGDLIVRRLWLNFAFACFTNEGARAETLGTYLLQLLRVCQSSGTELE